MRILVDMDGVLANFDDGFLQIWRERYPNEFYIPFAQRKMFYIAQEYPKHLKEKIYGIMIEPEFFLNLPPIDGGKLALDTLRELGHEVFICTTPFHTYENCVLEKYQWVDQHLGHDWTRQIIMTHDKTLVQADFLIDDKAEIHGVAEPPLWEQVIYDQPYNRHATDKRRLTWANWREVLEI